MSQANVETIRTALRALDRRDVELYLSVASPEIELITPAAPLEGANVGHEGIRRFFQELEESAESSSFEVKEVRAVGERVIAFFRVRGVGRISGAGGPLWTSPGCIRSKTARSGAPRSSRTATPHSKQCGDPNSRFGH